MGVLTNNGVRYHKGLRILVLGKHDHAIVMKKSNDGMDVTAEIGKAKGSITEGGILLATVASNLFRQEYIDQITEQINIVATKEKQDE